MSHGFTPPEHYVPAEITRIDAVTPLIKAYQLSTDPQRFHSQAGQWLDLLIPQPQDQAPLIGGYSILSAPNDAGQIQLAIKFADHHKATFYLHTRAQVGETVWVTPGQGPFYFTAGMAQRVVLLGAGIGVTPLFSILRHIHATAPEVQVHLVYSVASRREILFAEELQQMSQAPNVTVTLTITREAEDWRGHTGRISHPLLESLHLPRDAIYYYCGSREFIEDMTTLLKTWGLAETQLRYEKWW